MFYLETSDGDKFFTNKDSDDKKEFERIINDKLGRESADLFDMLVKEDEEKAEILINRFAYRYKECINDLDKALNDKEIDRVKLEEILSDLQKLYTDLML
jgi:hypothetical protein